MLLLTSHNSSGKKNIKKRRGIIYFLHVLYVDLRIKETSLILMAKNFISHMKDKYYILSKGSILRKGDNSSHPLLLAH